MYPMLGMYSMMGISPYMMGGNVHNNYRNRYGDPMWDAEPLVKAPVYSLPDDYTGQNLNTQA